MMGLSAAVGFDPPFCGLAHHANKLRVLAAVHTERHPATEDASQDEEHHTPDPGHSSRHFLGKAVSVPPANWAHQATPGHEALVSVDDNHLLVWGLVWVEALVLSRVVWLLESLILRVLLLLLRIEALVRVGRRWSVLTLVVLVGRLLLTGEEGLLLLGVLSLGVRVGHGDRLESMIKL